MLDLSDQHSPKAVPPVNSPAPDAAVPSAVSAGQCYRHYKGRLYRVTGECLLESTAEPTVLYRALDPQEAHRQWARPMSDFLGAAQPGGAPRFALLRAEDDDSALKHYLAPLSAWQPALQEVLARYDEPWRFFHTRAHVHDMFRLAQLHELELSVEQVLAILFHDAVCIPGAPEGQNERQSMLLAQAYKGRIGTHDIDWATVGRLIDETAQAVPSCELSATVVDLDLATLGDDAVHFCASDEKVWLENRHLLSPLEARKDFDTRRLRYLLGLASRGPLFTGPLIDLEEQARNNLEGLRLAWMRNYGQK